MGQVKMLLTIYENFHTQIPHFQDELVFELKHHPGHEPGVQYY